MRVLAAGAALAVVAVLVDAGCGKKGPPQPPIRVVPETPRDVRVRQIGADVVLTASLSLSRTDGTPLGSGATLRIYRLRPAGTSQGASPTPARVVRHQFEKDAKVAATLVGSALAAAAPRGRLVYRDDEALRNSIPGRPARLLYGLVLSDQQGRRSLLSSVTGIEVRASVPAPRELKVETSEGEIRLTWKPADRSPAPFQPPSPAAGEKRPGTDSKLLYNVYRRTASNADEAFPGMPLNGSPLDKPEYLDRAFTYGENYAYSVRALVGLTPPWQESESTPEVDAAPRDIYPPLQPTGLAVAAEGGVLKLYWFPNSEADLAGYRIFRREGGKGDFALVATAGAGDSSWADRAVRAGVRYDYCVSAFDAAPTPNESPRSEVHSETLPADAAAPRPESGP